MTDTEPADDSPNVATQVPAPPRPPETRSEAIKLIGGLVAITVGFAVLLILSVVAMLLVDESAQSVVAVATAGFGVIGSVVGAYFGVKIGTDGTQAAIASLKEEAAKAQAFAAHLPPERASQALADAQALRRDTSTHQSR